MHGVEGDLIFYILAFAGGTALVGGFITWGLTLRHGWKPALLIPLAIVLGAVGMVWSAGDQGLRPIGVAAMLALPGVLGAVVGLLIGAGLPTLGRRRKDRSEP
ncbi:MAG: hypothetical protein HC783_14860 [Rhodobacteraceae bacterium]|nr:hypothetical protein [Paracoccaceae bacterium]